MTLCASPRMRLRPMADADLERVLAWRNHPDVRRTMYTSHVISAEEHAGWWRRASVDPTRRLLVAEHEGRPVGFVQFTGWSRDQGVAEWGMYAGTLDVPGIGALMEEVALEYAFGELALEKLSCEVLATNPGVVALHLAFGFRVEGVLRAHHRGDAGRVDVIRLALLREDRALRAASPWAGKVRPRLRRAVPVAGTGGWPGALAQALEPLQVQLGLGDGLRPLALRARAGAGEAGPPAEARGTVMGAVGAGVAVRVEILDAQRRAVAEIDVELGPAGPATGAGT